MAEYITRNNAISAVCFGCNQEFSDEPCEPDACKIRQSIMTLPMADVVEVKHGEWKHKRATIGGEHYFCCSECGREVSVNMYDNPSVTKFYPYCHCGAKMDGERKDT